ALPSFPTRRSSDLVQRHALVVDHDQRAIAVDHRALGSKIQRHDRNAFQIDVLPDIQLGPVGQGEYADALALVHLAVVDVPQFRALVLRVPAIDWKSTRLNSSHVK